MQRRHIPPRFTTQFARFAIFITASLGFLIFHASVSVGAESELPANITVSPGNFTPLSWMCCTAFESTSVGNEKRRCGSGPQLCDEGDFETDSRDRAGLWRDTWYFLGYQAAAIVILYAMPENVSGWSSEQKEGYSMSIWWENVTHPQMDSDDFYINYILHPYWGAGYFVRARERGYNDVRSFWYSALLSSVYEFGVEALFEEPSIQDLIVTPVAGSLVGMYFMNVRGNILEREIALGHRTTKDKWL